MIEKTTPQSFVITAYKDPENLFRIVDRLSKDFNIFIHVDRSSTIITNEDIERLRRMPNVYAEKTWSISWGSYKHLLAMISLLCKALHHTNENGYVHLISGQDIPVKSNSDFIDFFDSNNHIYMDCRTLREMEPHQLRMFQIKNHLWRYNYQNKCVHFFRNLDTWLQKRFHRLNNNFGGITNVAQGLVWSSIPCSAVKYVIDYVDVHRGFIKDIYRAQIPEEFVFQTILINSEFSRNIVRDNLRYADWHRRNGSLPAYLDLSDYVAIINSGCFFARKIDSMISKDLLTRLGY